MSLQRLDGISKSLVEMILIIVWFVLGRDEEHQKGPRAEEGNGEEEESEDEESEEEDTEEEDDEEKLLDNPNVRECVAVGNFDAQQEGDLTFVVNICKGFLLHITPS